MCMRTRGVTPRNDDLTRKLLRTLSRFGDVSRTDLDMKRFTNLHNTIDTSACQCEGVNQVPVMFWSWTQTHHHRSTARTAAATVLASRCGCQLNSSRNWKIERVLRGSRSAVSSFRRSAKQRTSRYLTTSSRNCRKPSSGEASIQRGRLYSESLRKDQSSPSANSKSFEVPVNLAEGMKLICCQADPWSLGVIVNNLKEVSL